LSGEANTGEITYDGVTRYSLSANPQPVFDFAGGTAALDFVNTVLWRTSAPRENLHDYSDILRFCRSARLVSDSDASQLKLDARRNPESARRAFRKIIKLRERLYSLFLAVARGRRPAAADMEALNRALGSALHNRLVASGRAFTWRWGGSAKDLERVVWPIVLESGELLVSDGGSRIKVCRGDGCGFLFLDKSKNQSRRWCAMQPCGNRVKVRRYQSRHTN
jgi:predicted RNA-binding Zn ribbon-like protein